MNTMTHATLDALMRIPGNIITAERTITESFKNGRGWRSRRITRRVRLCISGEGTPDFIDTTNGRIAIKTLTVLGVETRRMQARKKAWTTRKAKQATRQFYTVAFRAIQSITAAPLALPQFAIASAASPLTVLSSFAADWRARGRNAVHPASAAIMEAKDAARMTWSQIARLS